MEGIGTSYWISKKQKKRIIIRNPKVLKVGMFRDSKYTTNKETIKSVSSLVATLGLTLILGSSKTQRAITLISTEAEYIAVSECAQEVKLVNILLKEMTEGKKPEVVYEENKGDVFLAKNR